jgi:Sigma-54 interaction domain
MSDEDQICELIPGSSPAIAKLRGLVSRAAPSDLPILIRGEPGSGKTEIAHVIHRMSTRSNGPFVAVSLAGIAEGLAESELFGHVRGAFTGAVSANRGRIASADGGTLFLDELDAAPPELQALLVRFLNNKGFVPVGGTREVRVDVRTIAEVAQRVSSLRRDLVESLAGIVIDIPPLRDRKEDILELATKFLATHAKVTLSDEAAAFLKTYSYPGNIRELHSALSRAAVFADDGVIRPKDLEFLSYDERAGQEPGSEALRRELASTRAEMAELQRSSIRAIPIWEGRRFETESDYCFVLMPFEDKRDMQRVYTNHVKVVIEERCNLRCERADDIHDISGVMQSVWDSINRARVIIAEMTERNPNVFYELGIAHTLGKPVIMITRSMEYVPFDLKHLRCIVYDYKPGSIDKFEDVLEKTTRRVLASTLASEPPKLTRE